ncbi:MAG: Smr/MutS family protein [Treponema sp.]|jgi:DNA-nicking Smr family endonuclease|nr:Smr/MutS family protein [Treponema sp.]
MDFGDILDAWDQQTARALGNRRKGAARQKAARQDPPSPKPPDQKHQKNHQKPNPLTAWLQVHGAYDKDAILDTAKERPWERRHRLLHTRADAVIDLHGLNRDDAWNALHLFFSNSKRQGFEKLLIVHGKGNHSGSTSVLKHLVKTFIETCPFAGESGHANATSGGTGVTWVLLKNQKNP